MLVVNTEIADLEDIFLLFEHSIDYQEMHGYPVWKNYDREAVIRDIEARNQYKVLVDSKMAIVFSLCYVDKIIWRDLDQGDSIYLHRIVVNPEFKGRRLFGVVLAWVIDHAREKGLKSIRMDTWQRNPNIIEYYKSFGFSVIENFTTPDSVELPIHNRNLALALLEYRPRA